MAVLDWFSYCPFIASLEKDVAAGINLHNEDRVVAGSLESTREIHLILTYSYLGKT